MKRKTYDQLLLVDHIGNAILKNASYDKQFILHDGPPYANGKAHVGHALNKVN